MVPFLDINRQNLALEAELTQAFQRVLASGQFILGAEVSELETALGGIIGVEHALGVSSGTDAILLALMALGIGPGDEVLCPAFTFFATAGCVARVGAKPVFVDVNPTTYNIDLEDAERKLTESTRAIMPVHLFGQCAAMDEVCALAASRKIAVIEDAAQSLGARFDGGSAGTFGDFGAFSFYPTKNLGALGDGGLLVCRNDELAQRARVLRNHGAEKTYHHQYIGGNFRLDALQGAFLNAKLPGYGETVELRQRIASQYTEKLSKLPNAVIGSEYGATDGGKLILPTAAPKCRHVWNQYTVRVPSRRDALRSHLDSHGIQTGVYYPLPLNRQECFLPLGQQESCPVSEQLSREVLSLPIYPELRDEQMCEVVAAVSEFLDLA